MALLKLNRLLRLKPLAQLVRKDADTKPVKPPPAANPAAAHFFPPIF